MRSVNALCCGAAAFLALLGCANKSDSDEGASLPPCADGPALACLADADSLDPKLNIKLAGFELTDGDIAGAACGRGGDKPTDEPEIDWLLCAIALDDGRQVVVGRAKDPGLIVRTTLSQRTVEFPAKLSPGKVIILNQTAASLSLIGLDGETVGRLAGPDLWGTAPE